MPTLWIHVWDEADTTALGDPLQEMKVTIGGVPTPSSAVVGTGRRRRVVRLFTDTDCHVTWGASPTANSDDIPMVANTHEYFEIEAGHAISVVERV